MSPQDGMPEFLSFHDDERVAQHLADRLGLSLEALMQKIVHVIDLGASVAQISSLSED